MVVTHKNWRTIDFSVHRITENIIVSEFANSFSYKPNLNLMDSKLYKFLFD
jgi:hypothetical protein